MGTFALLLPALQMAMKLMPAEKWMTWVNMALGIIVSGVNVVGRLNDLNDIIQKFVDEQRAPTDDEWNAMFTEDDRIYLSIKNAPLNPG